MITDFDAGLLIQGRTSAIETEIWFIPERHEFTITSSPFLEGPFSSRGKTLTTKFEFVSSKLGENVAWKAMIPEPVLWTPRTPALYRLGGIFGVSLHIGLRDIRIKGDSFYWEDRRWVARAAVVDHGETLLRKESPYQEGLVSIVPPLDSAFLAQADEIGWPMIVDATNVNEEQLADEVSRLSAHASVTMILLPDHCDQEHRAAAHSHVLLGALHNNPGTFPDWVDFVAASESLLATGWKPDRRLPIIATRECNIGNRSPAELHAKCDQLQADLDHGADYAGLWLLPKASS